MFGFAESFNVSVSAAIMLYELRRQMQKQGFENFGLSKEEIEVLEFEWTKKSLKNADKILKKHQTSQRSYP